MSRTDSIVSDLSCWVTAAVFALGLIVLAVRLREMHGSRDALRRAVEGNFHAGSIP